MGHLANINRSIFVHLVVLLIRTGCLDRGDSRSDSIYDIILRLLLFLAVLFLLFEYTQQHLKLLGLFLRLLEIVLELVRFLTQLLILTEKPDALLLRLLQPLTVILLIFLGNGLKRSDLEPCFFERICEFGVDGCGGSGVAAIRANKSREGDGGGISG
jgi:hypothetical protein